MVRISHGFCTSADIISMIKSTMTIWACGTGGVKEKGIVFMRKFEVNSHLENLDVDGKVMLKLILKNKIGRHG